MINIQSLLEQVNRSEISTVESVVTNLLRTINDPDSTVKDLKDIIEMDSPLTARVLKVANSAFYSSPRKIDELHQAIIWLGFDTLKEIALNQKICEFFNNREKFYGYTRIELWKHSLSVAICGKLIFRQEFGEHGGTIYSAGLLHDLGVMIEEQYLRDQFLKILKEYETGSATLLEIEKGILGMDHQEIGLHVARNWSFPEDLVAAIGYHHRPAEYSGNYTKLVKALHLADYWCQVQELGFCDARNEAENSIEETLGELNIKRKAMEFIFEEVQEQIKFMEEEGWFR